MILAAIACSKTQSELARIMRPTGVSILSAYSLGEADRLLASTPASVVLVDKDLPGGGWKEMVAVLEELEPRPVLVVTGLLADYRLWAEVLNRGGFDVLPRPMQSVETRRTLMCAYRESRVRRGSVSALRAALAT